MLCWKCKMRTFRHLNRPEGLSKCPSQWLHQGALRTSNVTVCKVTSASSLQYCIKIKWVLIKMYNTKANVSLCMPIAQSLFAINSPPYLTCHAHQQKKKKTSRDANERRDRNQQWTWDRNTNRETQRKQISKTIWDKERGLIFSPVHFVWPKPENLSHPQGPQDLRSNRQSSNTRPRLFFPHPMKSPHFHFEMKRINILF